MGFVCLAAPDGSLKTVREAGVSDHEPLVQGDTLTWNLWAPGSPGFGPPPTREHLVNDKVAIETRLDLAAQVLGEILENADANGTPINIICLQEFPRQGTPYHNYFLGKLSAYLPERLKGRLNFSVPTANSSFNQLTLVDESYSCEDISDEVLNATETDPTSGAEVPVFEDSLQGRAQILGVFDDQGNYREIANVHLRGDPGLGPTRQKSIAQLLNAGIDVVGDTNEPMQTIEDQKPGGEMKNIKDATQTAAVGERAAAGAHQRLDVIIRSNQTAKLNYQNRGLEKPDLKSKQDLKDGKDRKDRKEIKEPQDLKDAKETKDLKDVKDDRETKGSVDFKDPLDRKFRSEFKDRKDRKDGRDRKGRVDRKRRVDFKDLKDTRDRLTRVADAHSSLTASYGTSLDRASGPTLSTSPTPSRHLSFSSQTPPTSSGAEYAPGGPNIDPNLWQTIICGGNTQQLKTELESYSDVPLKNLNFYAKGNKMSISEKNTKKFEMTRTGNGAVMMTAYTTTSEGVSGIELLLANARRLAALKRDNHFQISKSDNPKALAEMLQGMSEGSPKLTATLRGNAEKLARGAANNPKLSREERAILQKQIEMQDKRVAGLEDEVAPDTRPQKPGGTRQR